ncbi:hypothetical protein Nepgr_033691 [Nepenthes gracilis]|uniref:Uncharacterized protein n=1 Tax=Nepenthes gracilis TaxID=150966 RepID=A0AAD3TMX1_NEPGR|nr:hypothetical protein Nepgr_033691 [Nepenthes gracilis]
MSRLSKYPNGQNAGMAKMQEWVKYWKGHNVRMRKVPESLKCRNCQSVGIDYGAGMEKVPNGQSVGMATMPEWPWIKSDEYASSKEVEFVVDYQWKPIHHGLSRPANHKSTRMNSAAHLVTKNLTPDVVSAGCGNSCSAEPMASKAIKQVPLDSILISPKAKIDSVVFSVPTSGLPGGLEVHSSNSDLPVLLQTDAYVAPANISSSGPNPNPSPPPADAVDPSAQDAGCSIAVPKGTSRPYPCLSDVSGCEAYADGISHEMGDCGLQSSVMQAPSDEFCLIPGDDDSTPESIARIVRNESGRGNVHALSNVDPDAGDVGSDSLSHAILTLSDDKVAQRCPDFHQPCCSQAARIPEGSSSGNEAAVQGLPWCDPNASPNCHQGPPARLTDDELLARQAINGRFRSARRLAGVAPAGPVTFADNAMYKLQCPTGLLKFLLSKCWFAESGVLRVVRWLEPNCFVAFSLMLNSWVLAMSCGDSVSWAPSTDAVWLTADGLCLSYRELLFCYCPLPFLSLDVLPAYVAEVCPDRQCFMRHIGPDGCVGIPVALFGFDSAVACFRPICIGQVVARIISVRVKWNSICGIWGFVIFSLWACMCSWCISWLQQCNGLGTAVGNFCWVLGICCKVGQICGPADMLLSTALRELKLERLQYPL